MVNKLQEVLQVVATDMDLPQIVVVGGQSSGKSSVLESIVGHDFLPRGTGVVTRCPLIIQLNQTEKGADYVEFSDLPGHQFTNFEQVRNHIIDETERITGGNKAISADPIIIKVYSPNVVPLTLVDTPGMTRIPVGSQPSNIDELINGLVHTYIGPKNTIILAVHSATQDIATSEAIQMARRVDPDGRRTVGVLTKLDLMDRGTDCSNLLQGNVVKLKHGFIGVVNRSQQDIVEGKPMNDSLMAASRYFSDHPAYRHLPHLCGVEVLARRLNRILITHVRDCLPDVRRQLVEDIDRAESELATYGNELSSDSEKRMFLLHAISKIADDFRNEVFGASRDIANDKLSGGARIRYILHDKFESIVNNIDLSNTISDRDILLTIRNAAGSRPSLVIPEAAFDALARREVEYLRSPSLQIVDDVARELVQIASDLDTPELRRFGELRSSFLSVLMSELEACQNDARALVTEFMELEQAFINTTGGEIRDMQFDQPRLEEYLQMGDRRGTTAQQRHREAPAPKKGLFSSLFGSISGHGQEASRDVVEADTMSLMMEQGRRESNQTNLLKKLVQAYFKSVSNNMKDRVVKGVYYKMINPLTKQLSEKLVSSLYVSSTYKRLLVEDGSIKNRRRQLKESTDIKRRALEICRDIEMVELPHLSTSALDFEIMRDSE